MSITLITCLLVLVLTKLTISVKILGVFMVPSYSHQIVYQPILKELSLRGHQVTVYTPFPLNDKSLVNLTEYDLGFSCDVYKEANNFGKSQGDNYDIFNVFLQTAEAQFNDPYMKDLIDNVRNESYDLLLIEYLYLGHLALKDIYKTPVVGLTSVQLPLLTAERHGMEKHPVVDPEFNLPFSIARTFNQRLSSWWFNWTYRIYYRLFCLPKINRQIKKYFGPDARDAFDYAKEVDLIIGNSNFAIHNIRPITPMFVPVSGLHLNPVKPLPKDLQTLLDTSINDIIYFSLGTNVKTSVISHNVLSVILKVLGRLPYTILWKCDLDLPQENLPKNIHIRKWFPQQDLLAHKKVKLFINQGGIQSIDEAISRKVPLLIIPFMADQYLNADRCNNLGISESIDSHDFTEEELEKKIRNLLTEPSYRNNIEIQHNIATDYPMSGLDTAIFWIEYVIRHKGARHLRYPLIDLPYYQYYLLDIYLFVFLIVSILIYIFRKVFRFIFCRKTKTKQKKL